MTDLVMIEVVQRSQGWHWVCLRCVCAFGPLQSDRATAEFGASQHRSECHAPDLTEVVPMTEIPDDEVEAAARAVERLVKPFAVAPAPYSGSIGWGATPADIARAALAAVRPRWEKQLAELRSENEAWVADHDAFVKTLGAVETERDAARAELERVRCSAQRIVADLIEAFEHIVMDTDEDRELHSRVIATARNAAAALRPVPEQEQP